MTEQEPADSLEAKDDPKSSEILLAAITGAEKSVAGYNAICQQIDDLYSLRSIDIATDETQDYQLFWASMEILKPSIYSRPPVPVVAPRFKDRDPVIGTASEMLERALVTAFAEGSIDEVMLETRDDLALNNRGAQWLTFEDDDGQEVCIEHLDRTDFLHEPARKWSDVGWVARRAWMTRTEMTDRFGADTFNGANFIVRREAMEQGGADNSEKAGVWEVWSKTDERVYWVTPGAAKILDEDAPHLTLSGFFPCPRPAYGTRKRRSLVPVPDYLRYSTTLGQISELTVRIYALLREVRLRGFFPAGGDIGEALETAIADQNSASIMIPVPAAAFVGASGGQLIQWIPLDILSTAIQGLISARGQLIQDFYEISGISDIMRGATNAQETLGAQQLKQQNGSIRVRDKVDELTRIAADTAKIAGEIMAEHFSADTLMDMSQMHLRTKAEIKKALGELEKTADAELKALGDKAKEAMQKQQGQPPDPEQAQKMQAEFGQAQQAIIAKYQPQIQALAAEVPIEDVMKLLRDERTRSFVIEIETDSTVLTDDMAEKASRAEFLNAFNAAASSIMVLAQAGEAGAELAGGMIKFALAPFRVGRELDGMIDKFVEDAEGLAKQAGGADDGSAQLAEAQQVLSQAEMAKAQAQMAKVQSDTAIKGQQMQMDAQKAMAEMQAKVEKAMADLQLAAQELQLKAREVSVKEREVAVKEAQAGVQNAATETDTKIKKGEAVAALGLDAALPAAVAATLAPAMSAQQMQNDANVQALRDQIAGLMAVLSAPKEIVRGPDGRALGVRVVSG